MWINLNKADVFLTLFVIIIYFKKYFHHLDVVFIAGQWNYDKWYFGCWVNLIYRIIDMLVHYYEYKLVEFDSFNLQFIE